MPLKWVLVLLVVCSLVVAVITWRIHPSGPQLPFGPNQVQVDTLVLFKDRPVASPPIIKRITTKEVQPQLRAISIEVNSEPVKSFCAPLMAAARGGTAVTLPPRLPPVQLTYDNKVLRFWSTRNDGKAFYQETPVRTPWEGLTEDSTFRVRGPRFGWLRDVRDCVLAGAGAAALGAAVGGDHRGHDAWIGAAVGCTATIVF